MLGLGWIWAHSLWNATVIGHVAFLYGCAIGHVDQWVSLGNTAPDKSGPIPPTESSVRP